MTFPSPNTPATPVIALEMQRAIDRLLDAEVTPERLAQADMGTPQHDLWAALDTSGLGLALLPEDRGGLGLDPTLAFSLISQTAARFATTAIGEQMIATALWGARIDGPVTLIADPDQVPYGRYASFGLMAGQDGRLGLVRMPKSMKQGQNLAFEPRDALDADHGTLIVETRSHARIDAAEIMVCGALLRAVQMCGVLRSVLKLSTEQAALRQQFGRKIGRFQAVQHMLADIAAEVAASDAIAGLAARRWGTDGFGTIAALAKIRVGEAAGKVAALAHQIHGANGFTREHPLHYATRRLWSWRDEFGNEAFWEVEIGRAVCAAGGAALWDRVLHTNSGEPQ